jgi:hypothetical protein
MPAIGGWRVTPPRPADFCARAVIAREFTALKWKSANHVDVETRRAREDSTIAPATA